MLMLTLTRHLSGPIAKPASSARTGLMATLLLLSALCWPVSAVQAEDMPEQRSNEPPVKVTILGKPEQTLPEAQRQVAGACRFDGTLTAEEGELTVRKIAAEENFDSDLVLAIARQESGFRMASVSSAGAVGLMQLMPATAKRFEVDICDPEDNVRGAIRYLRLLQKRYQNPLYVLAAYNAGEAAIAQSGGIPLYPETVRYVSAILTDLYGWKPLQAKPANQDRNIVREKKLSGNENIETWTQGFVLHVE